MKQNTSIINNDAFSILEMTVVLIIISILLSAVIPVLSRAYLEKAANKTALDISTIQDASRKYYIDNNRWPTATAVDTTPLAVLQDTANGYLPSASQWNAVNPFGASAAVPSSYAYVIQPPTPSLSPLTVCTLVPPDAQNIIINSLPSARIDTSGDPTNGYVCSSIAVPGESTDSWGDPFSVTPGVVHQAATDGYLSAYTTSYIVGHDSVSNANYIEIVSDSSSNPSTQLSWSGTTSSTTAIYANVGSMIKKGDWYKVNYNIDRGPSTVVALFRPKGV